MANKGLHCDPVPPCPCPEFEALQAGSSQGSGNAWDEEIDDEVRWSKKRITNDLEQANTSASLFVGYTCKTSPFLFLLVTFSFQMSENCFTPAPKKEKSADCGGHEAENGVTDDHFEWDFWDVSAPSSSRF